MIYKIIPNHFAPKRRDSDNEKSSHLVGYLFCNFNCIFCDFKTRKKEYYCTYDDETFDKALDELFKYGANFKFTGGEPTLNPKIIAHLSKIKDRGGFIYFDSNGSNPDVIEKLFDLGLIDVFGLSIKGITREEATFVSQRNSSLAWDNVLKTLDITGRYEKIQTLVTLVFTKANYAGRITAFANLIKHIPNVQLKINNLIKSIPEHKLISLPQKKLICEVEKFLAENPEWKGRIVLINSIKAVNDYSTIQFF